MTVKEITFGLENASMKMSNISSLALAINDAIVEGPNAAENFDGALYILTSLTHELDCELSELSKELFDIVKSV